MTFFRCGGQVHSYGYSSFHSDITQVISIYSSIVENDFFGLAKVK